MADDFEERLREGLRRDAARLPFTIEATSVRNRLDHRANRLASWIIPVVVPLAAALVIGGLILNAFPGPTDDRSGQAATRSAAPSSDLGNIAGASTSPMPTATPHPGARDNASIAVYGGHLFVVGGTRRTPLTSAVAFDADEGTWNLLPSLPAPRAGAALAALPDGTLMLAGGLDEGESVDSTLLLPPGADAWAPGPDLPAPQAHATAATVGDTVILFGGSDLDREDQTLIYDAQNEIWRAGRPMPGAVSSATAVVLDGTVYVLGGMTTDGQPSAAVYVYDAAADSWSMLPDLPIPSSALGATAVDGKIWAFNDARATVVFDPATATWTAVPRSARPGMSWYAPIVTNGHITVISGSSGPAGVGADSIFVPEE